MGLTVCPAVIVRKLEHLWVIWQVLHQENRNGDLDSQATSLFILGFLLCSQVPEACLLWGSVVCSGGYRQTPGFLRGQSSIFWVAFTAYLSDATEIPNRQGKWQCLVFQEGRYSGKLRGELMSSYSVLGYLVRHTGLLWTLIVPS